MKLISRSIAIFFAFVTICYFFTSCKNPANFHDDDKTGKKLIGMIKIIGYDIKDSSLTLRDDGSQNAVYVVVKKNQKIDWKVEGNKLTDFEIVSIAGDPDYSSSNDTNFFSAVPNGTGKLWTAKIGTPDLTKPFYKYIIKWKLNSDTNKIYTFDPLMQVNPK